MTDSVMGGDNAYTSLVEADDDARWAFGTSFDDPLAGVDTTVPAGSTAPRSPLTA